jgi:hypothetical protein
MANAIVFKGSEFKFGTKNGSVVAGTTITNAASGVFTSTAHGLANGDVISIVSVTGLAGLDIVGYFGTVKAVAANTFQLVVNSKDLSTASATAGATAFTFQKWTMSKSCQVVNWSFTDGQVSQTDTTGPCDTEATSQPGVASASTVQVSFMYLPQDGVQAGLEQARLDGLTFPGLVAFPNTNVNGFWMAPMYVTQFNKSGAQGGRWEASVSFTLAGGQSRYL